MAYRSNLSFGAKKRNRLLGVCVALTILGAGMTLGLLGGHVYLASSISKNTTSVKAISESTESLKAEVQTVKEQQKVSQDELEIIQDNLAKYEPVIIPDSMK
nr:hypothetical protein [uncultured Cellulosilyticum sp.]